MNPAILNSFPNDSGPVYQETLAGRFPVEPFNTYSNIFFLAIVIYYSFLVYRDYRNHRFLAYCLPVLFLGFIGGTVYHATRSHNFWMYLDWLPIVILCLAVSIYFIAKLKTTWQRRLILVSIVLLLVFGLRMIPWDRSVKTSMGYIGTVIGIVLPIFVYMYTMHLRNWGLMVFAVLSFALAISFRLLDRFVYFLPMGSHWLWHIFGALSVFFLIGYIYRDKLKPVEISSNSSKF